MSEYYIYILKIINTGTSRLIEWSTLVLSVKKTAVGSPVEIIFVLLYLAVIKLYCIILAKIV